MDNVVIKCLATCTIMKCNGWNSIPSFLSFSFHVFLFCYSHLGRSSPYLSVFTMFFLCFYHYFMRYVVETKRSIKQKKGFLLLCYLSTFDDESPSQFDFFFLFIFVSLTMYRLFEWMFGCFVFAIENN